MNNNVNHPIHYADTCSIECIDAMVIAFGRESVIEFCKINAFKYLWRFKNKNGLEDLNKAQWYINKCKELMYEMPHDSQLLEMEFTLLNYKSEMKKENKK